MARAKRENHVSKQLHMRVHHGKPIFPHSVSVEGKRMIMCSGQLAWDTHGSIVGKNDMRAQLRQVCENLAEALSIAGASWDDVVKTNTFTTDVDELLKHADVRQEYFGRAWPTSTTVEVRKLAHPDMLVEIEVVAVVD